MKGLLVRISGRWAQFRKPETNNTPLTHDFITKPALIGLMGAVLGVERTDMRNLFPQLSEDLLYGVQVMNHVYKESWAFTLRNANYQNDPSEKSPRQMEFLRNPDYTIAIGLANSRSIQIFSRFARHIENQEAHYTPVLGLHNCPAEIAWIGECVLSPNTGEYTTAGFALRSHKLISGIPVGSRVGFDRIPSHQNDSWWNDPRLYRDVIYPTRGETLRLEGDHYVSSTGERWCLI